MGLYTSDLFVPCQASDNLLILDSNNNYVSTIKNTGDGPNGVAVDINGDVIVTNMYSNTISIYNASNSYSRTDITVGNSPHGVVVDYQGNIYVACTGGNTEFPDGCIAIINKKTSNINYVSTYYHPFGIAIDNDGNLFTTHPEKKVAEDPWIISRFAKNTNYTRTDYTANIEPTGIAIDLDGNVWVACACSTASNGVIEKYVKNNSYAKLSYNVGVLPYGVAISKNGYAWVTNRTDGTVSSVKISDGTVTTYPCNAAPYGLSIDKDNNVFVCNRDGNKITKLPSSDYTILTQYDVGNYPIGLGDMTGLVVSNIINHYKYLIIDNNKIKTWNGASFTELRTGTTPLLEDFAVNGFVRLSDINDTTIPLLETQSFDVLIWSDRISNTYQIKTYAVPPHKLILQQGDLSIASVSNFNDITLTSNVSGETAVLRVIVSVDGGITWKAFNETEWVTIDTSVLDNVATGGMTPTIFNSLIPENWASLVGSNTTLRFGYYFNVESLGDIAELDKLAMDIDIKGYWKPTDGNNTSYEFRSLSELRVYLKADGNYKINYTVMREPNISEESEFEEWQQMDIIAPAGTTSSVPYVVNLLIPYTTDFRRREPHVLKFIPGTQNVVRTACDFNLTDNTKFTVLEDGVEVPGYQSKYVVWDGTMHFKTNYTFAMNDEGPLEDGRLFSIQITKSADGTPVDDQYVGIIDPTTGTEYKFKEITSMSVS